MDQASINRVWARLILQSLFRQGARHICIAPGSRSTPLTLEAQLLAAQEPQVRLHTHFDERGLAFFGLGLAKTQKKGAVILIVTSGTAVANLLPAIAESGLTREKLVVLTADRPVQLVGCGANQAIIQRGIFSSHVVASCDLPAPSVAIAPNWLLATLDNLSHQQAREGGTLHLNCPFPEPLYGEVTGEDAYLAPVRAWLDDKRQDDNTGAPPYVHYVSATAQPFSADWQVTSQLNGVLIAGRIDLATRDQLSRLAARLGWPLLCDPQAGQGSDYAHFDLWLQQAEAKSKLNQADIIIQFGARLVSKRLGLFISQFNGDYWLVEKSAAQLDPYHLRAQRICAPPYQQISAWLDALAPTNLQPWASELAQLSRACHAHIGAQVLSDRHTTLTEAGISADFASWLGQDTQLFIGNSMVVRSLDMLCQLPNCSVFANRGASGIDGLIATAAGVSAGNNAPLVCLLGDTQALYDLNSLALLRTLNTPLVLIVINNDGGAIFDLLPVPQASKSALYQMPHGLSFAHAAAMFELAYCAPTTLDGARAACLHAQQTSGATLIELNVPAGQISAMLGKLSAEIAALPWG